MNYKELYNKLSQKWEGFSLKDYIKLSPVITDNIDDDPQDPDIKYLTELDKNIQMISLLTGGSVEDRIRAA
jgi:hypothetical protein